MNVKKFLWDYKVENESLDVLVRDHEFMARVLSFGDADEVRELFSAAGRELIVPFLMEYGYKLDKRSFNYWRLYFGLSPDVPQPRRRFDDGCVWRPW